MPRPAVIVTLVHGTILLARWPIVFRFLRRLRAALVRAPAEPEWYRPDSRFADWLRRAFGETPVAIRSFPWAGSNTLADRLFAAVELRQHIARIADEHPDTPQVLVGHSHGGSVCLAAIGDPETQRKVIAFASLSTPYVHVRQRSDSENIGTALSVLGFLLFTGVMLATMGWLEPRVGEFWNAAVFTLALFAVMALGAAVLKGRHKRMVVAREWAQSLNAVQEGAVARLVVISDGDEALLALKIAEAFSAVSRGLWRAAYRVVELVEMALTGSRWRAWLLYAGIAGAFLVVFLFYDSESPWGPVAGVPVTIWYPLKVAAIAAFAPALVFLLVALALFVPTLVAMLVGFPPLVFFRWLAFGWGGSPGVDVTAESLPLGTVTAVRLTAPAGGRGLRHSELYNDARVPPVIAAFVQREVDAAAAAGKGPVATV